MGDLTSVIYMVLIIVAAYLVYIFITQPSALLKFMSGLFYVLTALIRGIFIVLSGITTFIFGLFRRKR
jgi:hypothetical protein